MSEMIPPSYLPEVLKWASHSPISATLLGGQYARRGHLEPREISAEEHEAYARASELLTELATNPCIRHDMYDGGYELVEPDDTTWVWDETEDEHVARLKALGPITIPIRTKSTDHTDGSEA